MEKLLKCVCRPRIRRKALSFSAIPELDMPSKTSRRDFLLKTASAATLVTAAARSATVKASTPIRKKIKVGQIGVGHSHAAGKVEVFRNSPDWELVGVVEADPAIAPRGRAVGGIPRSGVDERRAIAGYARTESRGCGNFDEHFSRRGRAMYRGGHAHSPRQTTRIGPPAVSPPARKCRSPAAHGPDGLHVSLQSRDCPFA